MGLRSLVADALANLRPNGDGEWHKPQSLLPLASRPLLRGRNLSLLTFPQAPFEPFVHSGQELPIARRTLERLSQVLPPRELSTIDRQSWPLRGLPTKLAIGCWCRGPSSFGVFIASHV